MFDFPQPLRLAVGSHQPGSGKGCAMNVVSYENGDTTITDMPACSDPMLARVVQRVNDTLCTHLDDEDRLCAECSVKVLDLAHRTVGTALPEGATEAERTARYRAWVRLALDEAESVARDDEHPAVTELRATVARWLAGEATAGEVREARQAAAHGVGGGAAAAAAYAHGVGDAAAAAAAYAAAAVVARAAFYAYAAYAGEGCRLPLNRAHALIDRFERYAGVTATPVPLTVTVEAVARMQAVTA